MEPDLEETRGTDPLPITVSNASTAAAPMPAGSCWTTA